MCFPPTPLLVAWLGLRPPVPHLCEMAPLPREPLLLTRPSSFSAPLIMQSSPPSHPPFKRRLRMRFLVLLTLQRPLSRIDSVQLPVKLLFRRPTWRRTVPGGKLEVLSGMLLLQQPPRRRPFLQCKRSSRGPFTTPLRWLWRTQAE